MWLLVAVIPKLNHRTMKKVMATRIQPSNALLKLKAQPLKILGIHLEPQGYCLVELGERCFQLLKRLRNLPSCLSALVHSVIQLHACFASPADDNLSQTRFSKVGAESEPACRAFEVELNAVKV